MSQTTKGSRSDVPPVTRNAEDDPSVDVPADSEDAPEGNPEDVHEGVEYASVQASEDEPEEDPPAVVPGHAPGPDPAPMLPGKSLPLHQPCLTPK